MSVDIFAHLFLEEKTRDGWSPVVLKRQGKGFDAATLAPGVKELALPYKEMGDVGYAALADCATEQFGLKKKPKQSRGFPKDASAKLRARFKAAREDELASLEDLSAEYAETLSLAEGWLTGKELAQVDWDRRWPRDGTTYRELFGATFFAQMARVQVLAAERELRVVFWFTS